MSLTVHPRAEPQQRSRADRRWDLVRLGLLAGWLLVAVAVVAVGERPGSWDAVSQQVAAGEVRTVGVAGRLPAGADGHAIVEVHWRDGLLRRTALVREVHGPATEPFPDGPGVSAVVHTDPGELLSRTHPGLRVLRETEHFTYATLLDWRVPGSVEAGVVLLVLAGIFVLVGGPEPWRATRWAWFWLLVPPLGGVAFLLLSGPTPLLPGPRDPSRRLTGGWAFLLALALGALLPGPHS